MSTMPAAAATHRSAAASDARAVGGSVAHGKVDFPHFIGAEGWWRLAPEIRRRFSQTPAADRPLHYTGVMERVECSTAGWLLAQALRLAGMPFAPHRGRDVPMDIALRDAGDGGIAWERTYRYPRRVPLTVRSVKRCDARGLVECVGFGLGMRLAVFEADHALHFLSLHYFATVAGRRFRLPAWLTPGTAHVVHRDLGAGRFRFTLTVQHRLLGTLFHQDGVFHGALPGDAS